MITIIFILLYAGGVIGVIKSAPEKYNPTHVLISGVLWPAVILSVVIEKFMDNHVAWKNDSGAPISKK